MAQILGVMIDCFTCERNKRRSYVLRCVDVCRVSASKPRDVGSLTCICNVEARQNVVGELRVAKPMPAASSTRGNQTATCQPEA